MAEVLSLSAVGKAGNWTGTALTAGVFAGASMVVTFSGYSQVGSGDWEVSVMLQITQDGSNWISVGQVLIGDATPDFVAVSAPGIVNARALISYWGAGVAAGTTITATVSAL